MSQVSASIPARPVRARRTQGLQHRQLQRPAQISGYSLESGDLQPWTLIAPISSNHRPSTKASSNWRPAEAAAPRVLRPRPLRDRRQPGGRLEGRRARPDRPRRRQRPTTTNSTSASRPSWSRRNRRSTPAPDPGPDNTLATADDLDWQSGVLQRLTLDGKPLEYVHYEGAPEYLPYWQHLGRSAPAAARLTTADPDQPDRPDLVAAIKAGASAALPACPPGQIAMPSSAAYPYRQLRRQQLQIRARISCAKGCRVVLVKITFDSAGNVIAESIPEEKGKPAAPRSAQKPKPKNCGKKSKTGKKCKKPKLIKPLTQAVIRRHQHAETEADRRGYLETEESRKTEVQSHLQLHADRRLAQSQKPHLHGEGAEKSQKRQRQKEIGVL